MNVAAIGATKEILSKRHKVLILFVTEKINKATNTPIAPPWLAKP